MKKKAETELQGWNQIAEFLGQPVAVLHRWSKEGLPVRRKGRYTFASRDELRDWLGRESGLKAPAFINAGGDGELSTELKRSVQHAKSHRRK